VTSDSVALAANSEPIPARKASSSVAVRRRVVLGATIGNALEWYDFLIYGFLAVTIGKLFFPAESELTSLLLSVATFGVGSVMRPIGAVVLGIYADRVGRKASLTVTIFVMALGTGLIAFAPTHASIGIWAPLLIVLSRLLQGFSCGGELGGATAILVEHAPEGRRGLYASWQTASQAAGLMLAAMITALVSLSMTPAQFEAGGWRWPFAIGLLIAPVGLYVRSKLKEPELFLKVLKETPVFSFTEKLRDENRQVFTGIGVAVLYIACAYILFVYMPTFAVRQLGLPFSHALIASAVASCVVFMGSPVLAAISDHYGRKPLLLIGVMAFALLTYPAFVMISTQPSLAKLTVVQASFALVMAMYAGPSISVYAELFPTQLRSTAVSLVYNITVAVVGGFAPLIVTWLIAVTGNPLAPAFYVIAASMISAAALLGLQDRFREPLR
jgi:MHS family proline/betaine transporter-like MFS transporter